MSSFLLEVGNRLVQNSRSITSVSCCVLVWLWLRNKRDPHPLPLPPGPRKLPILGNITGYPSVTAWKEYARWGKQYNSGIIHVDLAGQSWLIINSYEIAKELLDRRATIYSGRPSFVMVDEIMRSDYFFVNMQYGKEWKNRRGIFHQELHPSQKEHYHPHIQRAIQEHLPLYLNDPPNFFQHTRDLIGAAAISMSYGIKALKVNDPYILNAEKATAGLMLAQYPGRFLVEWLPFLKHVPSWFPGAEFKRLAAEWSKNCFDLVELPFARVKQDRVGEAGLDKLEPSLASRCLDKIEGDDDEVARQECIIKEAVGNFYFGAVDTSVSALHTFFLAMVLFPDVQKRAQEELDRVLPPGRLPQFSDEPSLPYLSALVKELLRWQPVTPIGVPHLLTVDDVFEGYHLPAGSIVIANSWAMLHDEEMYPEPEIFKPERFLNDDGQLNPDVRDPSIAGAFGFGRRICPGSHVAISMIWLFVASVLRTMSISPSHDKNGTKILPSVVYSSAIISHPEPFECTIRPRSKEAEDLVRSVGEGY